MKTIYKYPLKARNQLEGIQIPRASRILSVQFQPSTGELCLWAAVDTDQPMDSRHVFLLGTGHEAPVEVIYGFEYICSAQEGPFMWHVFAEPWLLGTKTRADPFGLSNKSS